MSFVQNFPFMTIILSLFSGPLSSIFGGKKAKIMNYAVLVIVGAMSLAVLFYAIGAGDSYVYTMGHFPAPWAMRSASASWKDLWLSFSASLCF